MAIPLQRDDEQTAAALSAWLSTKLDGASDLSVSNLLAPPSSGFSNETILLDVAWNDAAGRRHDDGLVVRVEPSGYQLFLEADFEQQYRLLEVLDRQTEVPVPSMRWFEPDPDLLGAPFFAMGKIGGKAPHDNPPYNQEGWLFEATADERRELWLNAMDAFVAVHSIPTDLVDFIGKPELGETGFDQIFEYWRRSFVWAADGQEYRIASAALEWMEANLPESRPTALSWGDSRIGNMLFDRGVVTAVLDWEMMSLGGHQMDLGWWLFLDQFHSFAMPRLDGLGTRDETIAIWEAGTGEQADDLEFYEIFAGFRFANVLMRIGQMYESLGVSVEGRGNMERDNAVLRLLAAKLDIEPPNGSPAG